MTRMKIHIVRFGVIFHLLEKSALLRAGETCPSATHQEIQRVTRLFLLCWWAFRTAWNEWKVGHSAKWADNDGAHYPISLYVVGESILVSHCYFALFHTVYEVSNRCEPQSSEGTTGGIRSSSVANQNPTIVHSTVISPENFKHDPALLIIGTY
jgi:hypothetical protein